MAERFVPVKELQELLKKREAIEIELASHPPHCDRCGDTKPKHGFYPLFSMASGPGIYQTSSISCNRCNYSDKQYEEIFNEPKEII